MFGTRSRASSQGSCRTDLRVPQEGGVSIYRRSGASWNGRMRQQVAPAVRRAFGASHSEQSDVFPRVCGVPGTFDAGPAPRSVGSSDPPRSPRRTRLAGFDGDRGAGKAGAQAPGTGKPKRMQGRRCDREERPKPLLRLAASVVDAVSRVADGWSCSIDDIRPNSGRTARGVMSFWGILKSPYSMHQDVAHANHTDH